jgi:hypothetical protein
METDMRTLELEELEESLNHEILTAIEKDEENCPALQDVQPPSTVMKLAVKSFVNVLMAFERGYQMGE